MEYSLFFTVWPWIGFGAAIVLLILSFATDFLRVDMSKPRWKDASWLAWIGAIAYMLHNMEEYGLDMFGTTMAFPKSMESLGLGNVSEIAYLSCNLGLVWIAGPVIAYLAKKWPILGACMPIFELINGVSHIGQAINMKAYNPGLLTSILIFIPLAIWAIHLCFGKGRFKWTVFWKIFGVAFLYHVILILGIFLAKDGAIDGILQGIIMAVDALLLIVLWYQIGKKAELHE